MPPVRRARDLTDAQNDHVRALVRELLKRHEHSQSKLAPLIGMKQPSLSGFLANRQGTSHSTALRAAKLAGLDVEDVLAGRATAPDPYPARARALAFGGDEIHPAARAMVLSLEPKNASAMGALDWMRVVLFWDHEARRGAL